MTATKSLRTRLLWAFLAVAFAPVLLLAGWGMFETTRALGNLEDEALRHQSTVAALEFENSMARANADLFFLSQLGSLKSLLATNGDERIALGIPLAVDLAHRLAIRPDYDSACLVDEVGTELARVVREPDGIRYIPFGELRDRSLERFFTDRFAETRGGEPRPGRIEDHEPTDTNAGTVLRIVTYLFDDSDRRRGILFLEISIERLFAEIRSKGANAESMVLIDPYGAFVTQPALPGADSRSLDLENRHPSVAAALAKGIAGAAVRSGGTVAVVRQLNVVGSGDRTWHVATVRPLSLSEAASSRARLVFFLVLLLALGIALLFARQVAGRLSRPILALAEDAVELGRGRFHRPRVVHTGDEIQLLGEAMERMASELEELYRGLEGRIEAKTGELQTAYDQLRATHERLKSSEAELVQAEKLASIGRLAASVAHEINNPAGIISMYAQLLKETTSENETRQMLDRVVEGAESISSTVRGLLDFTRKPPQAPRPVMIAEVVAAATSALAAVGSLGPTRLRSDIPEDLAVTGDPDQLTQVFRNLIENAVHASGTDGVIQVHGRDTGDAVEVTVSDNGPGISADDLPRIFEPFFTTKPAMKGTGLGLAVVYGIVQSHRGSITACNQLPGGAIFTIRLPKPDPNPISSVSTF